MILKSQLIETVLKVVKIHDDSEYQRLLDKIDEIKNMSFVTEVDRECHLKDMLLENGVFMQALLTVAMSDSWRYVRNGVERHWY